MSDMTEQEIIDNNKKVSEELAVIQNDINILEQKKAVIIQQIKAPCKYCHYDGEYRCEACESSLFEGFNVRDYPYFS